VTAGGLLAGVLWSGAGSASAGGGGHCADPTAEGTGSDVEMIDACFTPTLLRADVGETITFTNRDPMPHNVAPAGWGWGHVDALDQGDSFTASFDEPGVYSYACSLHTGMTGAIIVGPELPVAATASVVPPTTRSEPVVPIALASGLAGIAAGHAIGRRQQERRRMSAQPYQPASGA
jgi:plastocyanin